MQNTIYDIRYTKYKNILIIKPSSLGDIVLALPALSALRKSFPEARINWLIRPEFAPLLQNHPHLDQVIVFDRKFLGKAWYNLRALKSLFLLIAQLRRSRFDAVFDLQGLLRTALLAWLSGCRNRFGMANARELARIFYNHKVAQPPDAIHLVDFYERIIQSAGAKAADVEFVLPDDPAAEERIASLLAEHRVERNNYAVFVPGSVHLNKCWPLQNFAYIAKRLNSDFRLSLVAVGTQSDKPITEQLSILTSGLVKDFAGLTGLLELVALLRHARVVVSNDTGPGHIAGALGVPLVLIFGQVNPARLAPYGRPETVVAIDPDRRGPAIRSSDPTHKVEAVSVEQVYKRLCQQIEPKQAGDKTK